MDDLAPPPYSPASATTAVVGDAAPIQPVRLALRGGYMQSSLVSATPEGSNVVPTMTYYEDRQPSIPNGGLHLSMVEHTITVRPDTARDDVPFPLPLDTYITRDVTNIDWFTFMNHLFPMPDQTANEKQNSVKGAQHRSYFEGDSPERRQRILDVVDEWNEHFFRPRLIHIKADFAILASPGINSHHHANLQRSMSTLSISSASSSSSFSSVDSIQSKDLEGAGIEQLRSALLAFQLDPTIRSSLRQSVRALRDEFRSQRRNLPKPERKELKKEYKEQCKEIMREVKSVIKEVKTARKADRKQRIAERRSRRNEKRAEIRGADCTTRAQQKAQRKQERAERRALRDQGREAGRAHKSGRQAAARRESSNDTGKEKPSLAKIQAQQAMNGIQNHESDADFIVGRAQQTASRACCRARTTSRAACSASSKRGQ